MNWWTSVWGDGKNYRKEEDSPTRAQERGYHDGYEGKVYHNPYDEETENYEQYEIGYNKGIHNSDIDNAEEDKERRRDR